MKEIINQLTEKFSHEEAVKLITDALRIYDEDCKNNVHGYTYESNIEAFILNMEEEQEEVE